MRLRFEMLRSVYNASFSTLREALAKLAAEGLITAIDQKGFSVAPVSPADLVDLIDARVLIERELIRKSLENGDDDWEDRIISAFHKMERFERRHGDGFVNSPEWGALHAKFHGSLTSASNSPILLSIRANLFERAHRYHLLAAMSGAQRRDKDGEHRAIMDAVLDRRVEDAVRLIEAHMRLTGTIALEILQATKHQFEAA
jgi:DNA-binding GntR family transcriptional regulator